jgi:hypothetical protein
MNDWMPIHFKRNDTIFASLAMLHERQNLAHLLDDYLVHYFRKLSPSIGNFAFEVQQIIPIAVLKDRCIAFRLSVFLSGDWLRGHGSGDAVVEGKFPGEVAAP